MKQLLFATTALIATASMASAEVNVAIKGLGRFGIGYQEDRGNSAISGVPSNLTAEQARVYNRHQARKLLSMPAAQRLQKAGIPLPLQVETETVGPPADPNISDSILISRFRLDFTGMAETDAGVQFEARVRMEANDDDKGEAGKAELNGAVFSTIFGGLRVDAGNASGAIGNMLNRSGSEPGMENFIGQNSGINFSHIANTSTGTGPNAVFFNYEVGNFGFAASFDQNATIKVTEVDAVDEYVITTSGDVENIDRWDVSVKYTFGSITAEIAHGQNDLDESLTVLALGGNFGDITGTLLVADDDVTGESLNGTAYGLSAAYALSEATTINFAYGDGSAVSDTQKFGFGVIHGLGGGVSLRGGIGQTKVGGGDGRLQADFGAHFDF